MISLPTPKMPSPGRVYIPSPHMPRVTARYRVRFVNRGHRVQNYVERLQRTLLFRASASLRAYVIRAFKVVMLPGGKGDWETPKEYQKHSPPGSRPFLHQTKAKWIKGAIQFAVDLVQKYALVGVAFSRARHWGKKHEWGTMHGGRQFPKRPFMKPTFDRWRKYGLPAVYKTVRY